MALVSPESGGTLYWWVSAIAYPTAPSTSVPYYIQAFDNNEATSIIGGAPLAGPFTTKAQAQTWVSQHGSIFGKGTTNIAPPLAPGVAPSPLTPSSPNSGSGSAPVNVSGAHAAIVAVFIEMAGLAIVILIAGVNDEIANLMLIFMVGLLLLMIIMHSSQVSSLFGTLTNKEQAAS